MIKFKFQYNNQNTIIKIATVVIRILTIYTLQLCLFKMVIKTLMIRIQSIRFIAVEMDREDNNTSKTNRLIVDIDDYNKMMIWILDLKNIIILFRILVNILVFMD